MTLWEVSTVFSSSGALTTTQNAIDTSKHALHTTTSATLDPLEGVLLSYTQSQPQEEGNWTAREIE